ncbi:MAG: hypothetical protein V4631_10940 [Pseudomonadota bacterium]
MSKAAQSVRYFGVYVMGLGVLLMTVPNLLLAIFSISPVTDVWIRVVGVLAFNIGIYYWFAAATGSRAFFTATVWARGFVLLAFGAFVGLGLVSPLLILFALLDVAGAVWTWLALQSEKSAQT